MARERRVLRLLFCIAREEHCEVAVFEPADNRVDVEVRLAVFLAALLHHLGRRTQNVKRNAAAKVEHIAVDERLVGNVLRLDGLQVVAIELRRRRLAVVIDRLDLAVLEEDGSAAQMVGMGMGDDELVDRLDVFFLERRFELRMLVEVARVDEYGLIRRSYEDGVALPDVEHLDV